MTLTCGVDPGKQGGIALLKDGVILELRAMPEIHIFADLIELWRPDHTFLEKCQSMPGQSVSAMFNYGVHFGELQGILIAMQRPYTLVPPQTWQKQMLMGTKSDLAPKKRAAQAVQRLFPETDFKATERCKVLHDGIVDAALIALFGHRALYRTAAGM